MRVGFIGIGNMGRHMAMHIMALDHSLRVHDVRPDRAQPLLDRGAQWAECPRALAEDSDIICTSLPGPVEMESVVTGENGILDGIQRGAALVDFSTNSPQLVRQVHGLLQRKGAGMDNTLFLTLQEEKAGAQVRMRH